MEDFVKKSKILIVDDEIDTLEIFKRFLLKKFEFIDTANSAENAIKTLNEGSYDIVLTDLSMPDKDGIELIKEVKDNWPSTSIIVISGKASLEKAVEAMKLGAEDFIQKPVENLDLISIVINKILKNKWQTEEIERLRNILNYNFDSNIIIGSCKIMQDLLNKVKKIAPLDTTVLLTGETGVGKEVFAELIYRNSNRKSNRFVSLNCGSIAENLLESILFGHKKGAFTDAFSNKIGYFEEANNGTIFLDEISETSQSFQIKLLRVLENNVIRRVGDDRDIDIDVRVIAASNKDLKEEVRKLNFRQDLFYRLNVISLNIPPLRKRKEDIPLLALFFLKQFAKKHNKEMLTSISNNVMDTLISHHWEGNVRELKNVVEYSVAMASHNQILHEDLPAFLKGANFQSTEQKYLENLSEYSIAKKNFDKNYLEKLLQKTKGNISEAADISKIARPNLYQKIEKLGIDIDHYRN